MDLSGVSIFFYIVLCILALLTIICLVRAVKGPSVADRLVVTNMMGTIVSTIIAILSVFMGEGYLADLCIVYAAISFLAVIILSKIYLGVYREKKEGGEADE